MILNSIIEQFQFPGGWWGIYCFGATYSIFLLIFCFHVLSFHFFFLTRIYKLQCRFLYENVFKVFLDYKFNYVCNLFLLFWMSVLVSNICSLFYLHINVFLLFRVVLILTFTLFIYILFSAILRLRLRFFGLFMPCNVPGYLIKSLIIIETFVFFLRVFSLSLRFFINLVTGHVFLKIIYISFLQLFSYFLFSGIFLIDIFIIIFFVISFLSLEAFVASLQTFIFFFLLNIYLQEVFPDNEDC